MSLNPIVKDYMHKLSNVSDSPDIMYTNFAKLSIPLKIAVLDTIVEHAQDVFGPLSGMYGEVDTTGKGHIRMFELNPEDVVYTKSSDGHSFFNKLTFGSKYGLTIMKMIQQQTKYISGYEGGTSRDGTTSLGIISSLVSKNMLAYNYVSEHLDIVPKAIREMMYQAIVYAGTKLITEEKINIYNRDKREYVTDPVDGEKLAISAIETTVAGNKLFVDAFTNVIKEAKEKKLDVTSCFKASPNRSQGEVDFKIDVEYGIKMRSQHIGAQSAQGFKNNIAPMFIFDGFIKPSYADNYLHWFQTWVKQLCSLTDPENGLPMFHEINPNYSGVPVIMVTRTPDYLKRTYDEIAHVGVDVRINTSQGVRAFNIKPIIMVAMDTDELGIYYQDAKTIFSECIVDLNAIQRHLSSNTDLDFQEYNEVGEVNKLPTNTFDMRLLFPVVDIKSGSIGISVPYTDGVYDDKLGPRNAEEDKYNKINKEVRSLANCVVATTYDGKAIGMNPMGEELLDRIIKKREELIKMRANYSTDALESSSIEQRLDFFSGVSLKPHITCRTDDEYINMWNLYEDALGVFETIHEFGVMPGANTFVLKSIDKINNVSMFTFMDMLKNKYPNTSSAKFQIYLHILDKIIKCIHEAYKEAYLMIDVDGGSEERAEDYSITKDNTKYDFIEVHDVITGNMSNTVLEAARTTADVFVGSVSMGFDMINLKRMRVNSYEEWSEVITKMNSWHSRNDKYLEEEK